MLHKCQQLVPVMCLGQIRKRILCFTVATDLKIDIDATFFIHFSGLSNSFTLFDSLISLDMSFFEMRINRRKTIRMTDDDGFSKIFQISRKNNSPPGSRFYRCSRRTRKKRNDMIQRPRV